VGRPESGPTGKLYAVEKSSGNQRKRKQQRTFPQVRVDVRDPHVWRKEEQRKNSMLRILLILFSAWQVEDCLCISENELEHNEEDINLGILQIFLQ
jgi:hypothetical protein